MRLEYFFDFSRTALYFFLNFYWSIVPSQYFVSFYCKAKWISFTYTCILSFMDFLPHLGHHRALSFLYSRFSLVICFLYSINSVYMSMPVSQFFPPHPSPWYPYICSLCLCLYFCFANKAIIPFSRFHIHDLIYGIHFSLSDLLHSVWQSLLLLLLSHVSRVRLCATP